MFAGVRGSFTPSDERGQPQRNPVITLNEFIGKQGWQDAARTLAHEIGHFIDYVVAAVQNADLARRLSPLQQTAREFTSLIDGDGDTGRLSRQGREILRAEAIALSTIMRGPFEPTNPYRNASVELYADFLSAILIDPETAFDTAPFLSHAFFAALEQKPEAHDAWHLLQDLIRGDLLHEAIRESTETERQDTLRRVVEEAEARNQRSRTIRNILNTLVGAFWSKYVPAGAKRTGSIARRWWLRPFLDRIVVNRPRQNSLWQGASEGAERAP